MPEEGFDLSAFANTGDLGVPSFDIREGDEEGEGITDVSTDDIIVVKDGITPQEEAIVNTIGMKDGEGNEVDDDDNIIVNDDDDTDETSIISAFTELGIIDLDEEELKSDEERDLEWFASKALDKVNKGVEEGIEDYKDSLPNAIKALLDDYEDGVPLGALLQGEKELFDVASVSEEKLEGSDNLQKKMITELLSIQGETSEEIEDRINDYEDSGLLEKYAKRAQSKLIKVKEHQKEETIRQAKAEEVNRREGHTEWLTNLKSDIDKMDEIIPGIVLNDKQRKDLYNGITKVDNKGKNAVMKYREANPNFDLQVAYLATVLKGDFSSLEASADTRATKKLKNQASSGGGSSISKKRSSLKGVDLGIMRKFA